MFTVRVEQSKTSHVTACAQYVVEHANGQTVLTLYGNVGDVAGQVPVATIALDDNTRAFVMNDNGKTVDTYRGRS